MTLEDFRQLPVIGILRGLAEHHLAPLLEAAAEACRVRLEITMHPPGAGKLIRQAAALAGKRLWLGAGTVTDMNTLHTALDNGACFIVMPVFDAAITGYCREHRIPVFPGALTPQEIFHAWQSGAEMVKVFPASAFGPAYFKQVKGPFDRLKLLACGGVGVSNLAAYLAYGADGVAFGAGIFRDDLLARKAYGEIGALLQEFIALFKSLRPPSATATDDCRAGKQGVL
jgi:2-dehydro-3-deoxyphosphogluconate aldolase/(4S)-4-hydroxy-2-oxoglutarate aldolase